MAFNTHYNQEMEMNIFEHLVCLSDTILGSVYMLFLLILTATLPNMYYYTQNFFYMCRSGHGIWLTCSGIQN